jgi:chaperone BCS1
VVLREGQMETLVGDLGEFLGREADYVRRGLPWHRGYLLQGPPGTGKTSLTKALAHEFGLDLWYAPLGDLSKDTNLLALLSEVRPRSMLLLEDIDIYHAATTREAEADRVTLSGLLNALDGVSTPHGLITVLTSNEPKVLDDALVRPGRIDRVEDIDYVTQEQAGRLFAYFYQRPPRGGWVVDAQTSTADLTELFKRHMDDPDGAEAALHHGHLGAAVRPAADA